MAEEVPLVGSLEFRSESRSFGFAGTNFASDFLPIPAQSGIFCLYHLSNVDTTAKYFIKCLVWFQVGLVRIREQVVILVILSNSWNRGDDRNIRGLEDIGITQSGSFKNQGAPQSTR